MRFVGGVILALALASSGHAQGIKLDTVPDAAAPPLEPGAKVAPVSLTRMGANIPEGQLVVEIRGGFGCIGQLDTLRWRSELNRFDDADFQRIFREEFNKASLVVAGDQTDLFQDTPRAADLQIGALLTDIKMRMCRNDLTPYNTGGGTIDVTWQVYSTSEGKVVARIPTRGGIKDVKAYESTDGIYPKLLQAAFAANVRHLLAHPDFRRIVINPQPRPVSGGASSAPLQVAFLRPTKPSPLKEVVAATVAIFAGDGMGSGALISSDGYIVTNHHVAGDGGRVRVRWADGSESVGEVVRADRRRDVALIKTTSAKARPLALRQAPVELGETVHAIGTPLDPGLQNTVTRGIVSATRMISGQSYIQSDTPITNGNSGGPLIDANGAVVGLSVSGVDPSAGSTINFFVPINDAVRALGLERPQR